MTPGGRGGGRPRQLGDEEEQRALYDAAYRALREHGSEMTVAAVLAEAGLSTRSFYRHFDSKDALLRAMYLRDADRVAERLRKRLADATSPADAVARWIDEVFAFRRSRTRAERVAVLGSIGLGGVAGAAEAAAEARSALIESLEAAITEGVSAGAFTSADPHAAAELVAAAALHAVGLPGPGRAGAMTDQAVTTEFCLRALGAG